MSYEHIPHSAGKGRCAVIVNYEHISRSAHEGKAGMFDNRAKQERATMHAVLSNTAMIGRYTFMYMNNADNLSRR